MKAQFVKDLSVDMAVDSIFKVIAYDRRTSRSGEPFLAITLADRTGRILARRWDVPADEADQGLGLRYARVQGVVERYKGARQIRIDAPIEAAGEPPDPSEYEPSAALGLGELQTRLMRLIDSVQERFLHDLLITTFTDADFRSQFDFAPAAKGVHHATRHGLLQHTVEVAELAQSIARGQSTWGYPAVDSDLVVSGALLHDVGKVRELDWSEASYEYTVAGGLLGHIAIGYETVSRQIAAIPEFSPNLRDSLLHIILAHHGKLDHGSPVTPMLREAQIVAVADDLSVRLYCMTDAILEADGRNFGWHRAVEGGRVYAGPLGTGQETRGKPTPNDDQSGVGPAPEAANVQGGEDRNAISARELGRQTVLDLPSAAAAILNTVGRGKSAGRFKR